MESPSDHWRMPVRYWERRRIIYNLALTPPALIGWGVGGVLLIDGKDHPTDFGLLGLSMLFMLSAVGANVLYSLVYALEYFLGMGSRSTWWDRWGRTLVFGAGTVWGVILAFFGGREIALIQFGYVRVW